MAIKAGAALIKNTIDYTQTNSISSVDDGINILKNSAIDVVADKVIGGVADVSLSKVGKSTLKKVSDKLVVSNTKATKAIKSITVASTKTAKKLTNQMSIKKGSEALAKGVKDSPKTVGEIFTKGASNEATTKFKDATNIKK